MYGNDDFSNLEGLECKDVPFFEVIINYNRLLNKWKREDNNRMARGDWKIQGLKIG